MMIARVIGTVVSTRKEPTMDGLRLLVCQPVNAEGEKAGAPSWRPMPSGPAWAK